MGCLKLPYYHTLANEPEGSGFIAVDENSEASFAKLSSGKLRYRQDGYLFIYLANESAENENVYFDDFIISHTSEKFHVTQVNEYYPFGLATSNSYRATDYTDPGMLYQSAYASYDSITGYYDFLSRNYDPELGRWFAMNPAGQFASGYVGMGNNPVMMADPDGELAWFVPLIIGAVLNVTSQAMQGNIDNFWDALGYAAVGAASGYAGGAIGGANIAFSNTLAIAGASTLNSVGNYSVSGGKGDIYTSFGGFSVNWSQGDVGYLGEKGNSDLENFGFALGALANLNDVNNLIDQTKATLYTQEQYANGDKDIISHSGIVDDATGDNLISFGPNDNKIGGGGFKDQVGGMKPGGGYKKFGLAVRKGTPDYPVPVSLSKSTSVTANKHLFKGLRGFSKIVPYQGCTTNCVNMSSLGLWLNGIPNIGIHPYLLHYSMVAYNSGVRPDLVITYRDNDDSYFLIHASIFIWNHPTT